MDGGIIATLALVYVGFTALLVASAIAIVRKAGYSAWWVCAGLVPLVNLVMLFAFAFADWPALRESRIRRPDPANPSGHPGFAYAPQPAAPAAVAPPAPAAAQVAAAQVAAAQVDPQPIAPQPIAPRMPPPFSYPDQSGTILPGR